MMNSLLLFCLALGFTLAVAGTVLLLLTESWRIGASLPGVGVTTIVGLVAAVAVSGSD